MLLTKELLSRLRADHPDITIVVGTTFKWSQARGELTMPEGEVPALYALHELAHAVLGHTGYRLDIELLRREREAWDAVRTTFAPHYEVPYDVDLIEDSLDTYRDWLHARALCPTCNLTGIQTKTNTYSCINCRCSWRPNDARQCALRRYKLT